MAVQDLILAIRDGLGWRWDALSRRFENQASPEWARHVMDQETARLVGDLPHGRMDALEISGEKWRNFGFRSYQTLGFDEYDVCERPYASSSYDLVIVEQVLEHVLWPYRAVRHLFKMLRPSGFLLVTTPFLVKIHGAPIDCSRWTELGMRHLLAEGGFPLDRMTTGSWGNRMCVRRGLQWSVRLIPWYHTLRNEPTYPVVVWALAQKYASSD